MRSRAVAARTSSGREPSAAPINARSHPRPASIGRIDTRTPVVVLSARNYGPLGIFRSLGRLGIPVFAVDGGSRSPAATSRYLRGRYRLDIARSSPDATIDALLTIGRTLPRRALLIPTSDETALLASDHHARLEEHYLVPRQPPELASNLANKNTMQILARQHGIPTPEVRVPNGSEDVAAFASTAVFPVMLKGIDGARLKERTGRKMVIVAGPDELVRLYREMEDPANPNLMLQEYVPGGDDTIWMFNGYFDSASDCVVGFTGRKLRQSPPYTGVTSLGICLRNDVVAEQTTRWMKELGYRGILDIGYRFDARDGSYKVLDVNPRIGATFRLFVARNGMDVVRALYLDMTGQDVPLAEQIEGRKWLVEGADFDSFVRYRRDGRLSARAWVASLAGVDETAYFATDDLRPFVGVCADFVRRKLGRAVD